MQRRYRSDFGNYIKQARLLIGKSQKSMADAIGVSKSTYSLYESGKRFPSYEKAIQIANVLNLPMKDFMLDMQEAELSTSLLREMENLVRGIKDNEYDRRIDILFEIYLNDKGKDKVIDHGLDLAKIPDYRKPSAPDYFPDDLFNPIA